MFEYFNSELLKIMVFAVVVLFVFELSRYRPKSLKRNMTIYASLIVAAIFFSTYYNAHTAKNNRDAFSSGHTLKCAELLNNYRVSISDGWEIDKQWFVKESLMIRCDNCEEL